MNPVMVPRSGSCVLCKEVSTSEDVDVRLWDADGMPVANPRPARDYLVERMGWSAQKAGLAIGRHIDHVERFLDAPTPSAPINAVERVAPLETAHWLDVNQNAMNLGNAAMRDLAVRLEAGDLDPKITTQLAKLGVTAAASRGNLESRGKGLAGIDKLIRLAGGQ